MSAVTNIEDAVIHAFQAPPASIVDMDVFGYEGEALWRDMSRRVQKYTAQMDQWIEQGEAVKEGLRQKLAAGRLGPEIAGAYERSARALEVQASRDAAKNGRFLKGLRKDAKAHGAGYRGLTESLNGCVDQIELATGREINAMLDMALFLRALRAEHCRDTEEVAFEITSGDTASSVKGKCENAA